MEKSRSIAAQIGGMFLIVVVSTGLAQTAPTPSAEATRPLTELITRAGKIPEHEYTFQSWNEMRFAMEAAVRLSRQKDADPAAVAEAMTKLKQMIDLLQKRVVEKDQSPRIGFVASLVASRPAGPVNSVELQWAAAEAMDRFEIHRTSADGKSPEKIYSGSGRSFYDYDLPGGTYTYQLRAFKGDSMLQSHSASIATLPMLEGFSVLSNQFTNKEPLPGRQMQVKGLFYDFRVVREGKGLKNVLMKTSSDGKNWSEETSVMDLNSHPDLADCKFESGTRFYDKVNDQIVWWLHWERSNGYGDGKALVATAKPGQPFKVHRIYNPLGVQVRDMVIYIDPDDHKGYLVAASNVRGQGANATMYIFRLNDTYDDAVEIIAKIAENGYREAPAVIKNDGIYYLFYSQAAGWYPSRGGYVSAPSMAGPWTALRSIGNPSTFACQSGWINEFGSSEKKTPLMMGSRWIRGEGEAFNHILPIQMAKGFAFYDFAPALLHNAEKGVVIPLQMGRLLSQGQPAEASIPAKPGHSPANAFDGDYESTYEAEKPGWPFSITSDLGSECEVRNVQISWIMNKGSEAFFTYTIEGSEDGRTWSQLMDRTDVKDTLVSKSYGFTSDILPEKCVARYVRINIKAAHLHNNSNNWYASAVHEIKIFGERLAKQ